MSLIGSRVIGVNNNAWDDEDTGAGGESAVVDLAYASKVSIFGNTSGATDVEVEVSADGNDFFTVKTISAWNGDNHDFIETASRYMRLKSSADIKASITISAKV